MTSNNPSDATVSGAMTPPMRAALERLRKSYLYVDGRSVAALVRRGLARYVCDIDDALVGQAKIHALTPLGIQVADDMMRALTPDSKEPTHD